MYIAVEKQANARPINGNIGGDRRKWWEQWDVQRRKRFPDEPAVEPDMRRMQRSGLRRNGVPSFPWSENAGAEFSGSSQRRGERGCWVSYNRVQRSGPIEPGSLDRIDPAVQLAPSRCIMHKYKGRTVLGAGQYGEVFRATGECQRRRPSRCRLRSGPVLKPTGPRPPPFAEKSTGKPVALKKFLLGEDRSEEGISRSAVREIKVLREISSPFVVRLYDAFVYKSNVWVALELCTGDLEAVIKARRSGLLTYTEADIKSYMFQILSGLHHLEAHNVLHRDVKPNNIMFGVDGCLKLIDFGLSRVYPGPGTKCTPRVFNQWYRAPELLLGARAYGFPVDMWACGCTMAEIFRGTPLFASDRESELAQLSTILKTLGPPSQEELGKLAHLPHVGFLPLDRGTRGVPLQSLVPGASDLALDLIRNMLRYVPGERVTPGEALRHPFFTEGVPMTTAAELPRGVPKKGRAGGGRGSTGGEAEAGGAMGAEAGDGAKRAREEGPEEGEVKRLKGSERDALFERGAEPQSRVVEGSGVDQSRRALFEEEL